MLVGFTSPSEKFPVEPFSETEMATGGLCVGALVGRCDGVRDGRDVGASVVAHAHELPRTQQVSSSSRPGRPQILLLQSEFRSQSSPTSPGCPTQANQMRVLEFRTKASDISCEAGSTFGAERSSAVNIGLVPRLLPVHTQSCSRRWRSRERRWIARGQSRGAL